MSFDTALALELFDEERKRLVSSNFRAEHPPGLVRWHSIIEDEIKIKHTRLSADEVPLAVQREVDHARRARCWLEWQLHAHDVAPGLEAELREHGFVPGPKLALMLFDLEQPLAVQQPLGCQVRRITEPDELGDYERVLSEAWLGQDFGEHRRFLEMFMERWPERSEILVTYVAGRPVSCARALFDSLSQFVPLVGGATVPEYRGRGYYSHLVARRATSAKAHGARYLSVAASADSSPRLGQLGFVLSSWTTSWELAAEPPDFEN